MSTAKQTTTTDDLSIPEALRATGPGQPVKAPTPVATEVKSDAAKPAPVKTKAKFTGKRKADKVSKAKPAVDPETGEPKNPRSVVPVRYKARYSEEGKNGTCGDALGLALKAHTFKKDADGRDSIDMEALLDVAKANNVDVAKYKGLNNGMVRMNISNKLRGLVRHGETVVIGKQKFKNPAKVIDKAA